MAKTWVYSDFSKPGALYLEIDGTRYDVVSTEMTFAVNTIPGCTCILSVGRNATNGLTPSAVGANATKLLQMKPAKLFFEPNGEYDQFIDWPKGPQVIFDGLFMGFAWRKINGKITVTATLSHWLVYLAFGSALTANGHVANPSELNVAAVTGQVGPQSGEKLTTYLTGDDIGGLVSDKVEADLWVALKSVFCQLASLPTIPIQNDGQCGGGGNPRVNDAALSAINRMEGPTDTCTEKPYKYGVPLALTKVQVTGIVDAIAATISSQTADAFANTTFWDKLVGTYCGDYGLAVVPRIDTSLVIADMPIFAGDFWRSISPDEYDYFDFNAQLDRPLRAVGIIVGYRSESGATGGPITIPDTAGGCFAPEDPDGELEKNGVVHYIAPPPWLTVLKWSECKAGVNFNHDNEGPAKVMGAAAKAGTPQGGTFGSDLQGLYTDYAALQYYMNTLRGRSGRMSGKLRFDIAPGSIVQILGTTEKFIGGEDQLGATLYGYVASVTISLNVESPAASTSFLFTYVRTEAEFNRARESASVHWLFGDSIHGGGKHGAPLLDAYEFPPDEFTGLPQGAG